MKRVMLFYFLLIFSLVFKQDLYAQNKSNKGKEFWLGYGHNIIMTPGAFNEAVNSQEQTIYLSTDVPATVTVSVNGTSWSQTIVMPANTVNATILIPKTGANDARLLTEGLSTKGIHIVSDTPIVVYAHEYATQSSAATMLMPVETWGYNYSSLNFYQISNYANSFSWFFVVASEDNTRLLITPADTTQGGWIPTQTYTVNLNKGEIYNVFGKQVSTFNGKDMTGSKVTSVQGADGKCHPVAMFCGSSRNVLLSPNCTFTYTGVNGINVVNGHGGEILFQQMFPANTWGTRYLTYHCINNTNNNLAGPYKNLYRVVVKEPSTIVKRNGVLLTGLINNFFYEYESNSGDYIEANKPILMAQYLVNSNQCMVPVPPPSPLPANGDPEMIFLSPIEQGIKSTLFFAARRTSAIGLVYVNVIVPTAGVSSLLIDGNPIQSFEQIPHPNFVGYSVVARRFLDPEGKHLITCDSAFTAINYGLGDYESYGYNAGCLVNNLDGYGNIKNTNNTTAQTDTVTCPTTPVKLSVKLAYPATSITWKLSQVNGMSPNVDVVDNAPAQSGTEILNGRTYYVYTLPLDYSFANTGIYAIPIEYRAIGIDACNSEDKFTFLIKVKPGPKADFTTPNACPNQSITLTGTSSNNGFTIGSYLWNFPDATTQNTINAVKTFTAIGNFIVRYRIFATNGCVGDTTKVVTIGAPNTLTVQGIGKACADSVFTFTSSIPQNSTNPTTYYWDFGDGSIPVVTTTNTTTHIYSTSTATRNLKHAVSFAIGCGTDTIPFTIPAIKPNPAAVLFNVIGDTLCPNKPLQITASATNIAIWNWNLGNATLTTAPPFNYTYGQPNTYTISLVVKDLNGCGSLPSNKQIVINPLPSINAGPDITLSPGSTLTINASITNPSVHSFLWTPATGLSNTTILNPITSALVNTTYTITALNSTTKCISKDSMEVKTLLPLFIPNTFTPNGDNVNDRWIIPAMAFYPNAVVTVYNRFGEKIFETKNYASNPWDGRYKQIAQPQGSYVYYIYFSADKINTGIINIIK
jgi:gliding motility-associated-like protein